MPEPEGEDLLLICHPPDEVFENAVRTVVDDIAGPAPGIAEAVERQRQPVALVVDDEPSVPMLLSAILAARGWHVIQASNGYDALAKVDGIELDLLVTDYDMPGMDGRTLARRLCERHSSLRVLVVSGHPDVANWVEGPRHDFLAKPFGIHDLALRVESLTGYAAAWNNSQSAGG